MCVCAFGLVRLTQNSTLTPLAKPNYSSVHAAVQSGTPSRRKALLKAEGPANIKHMLVTVDTSCFVVLRHLARACAPSPSLTLQNAIHVRLATPASTLVVSVARIQETGSEVRREMHGRNLCDVRDAREMVIYPVLLFVFFYRWWCPHIIGAGSEKVHLNI